MGLHTMAGLGTIGDEPTVGAGETWGDPVLTGAGAVDGDVVGAAARGGPTTHAAARRDATTAPASVRTDDGLTIHPAAW
jgi:hypothetical protein